MILPNPRGHKFLCRSNPLLFPSLARMGGGGAKFDRYIMVTGTALNFKIYFRVDRRHFK